ncbi:MAG: class I SAM-dependent methyltransferase [archaeon]
MVQKNTASVWDNQVYNNSMLEDRDKYFIEYEKKSIRWKRIKEEVIKRFGSFKGLKSIEIGSGQGFFSLLFAMEGADVTVLDYSKGALNAAKLLFKRANIKNAKFIQMDALNLDKSLYNKFDVSMSFGTAEHFKNENRIKFIRTHKDTLKVNGVTFLSVPNSLNLVYRTWKFLSQKAGRWQYGEEYPFTHKELKAIFKKIDLKFEKIVGASLFFTHIQLKRRLKTLFNISENWIKKTKNLKPQIGTPLDAYFASDIVAIGKRIN